MWPLEHFAARELLRVGKHSVQRWRQAGGCLQPIGHCDISAARAWDCAALGKAIGALYPAPPAGLVSAIIESAWAPVLLVETGATLWSQGQVDLLVRHRLGMLYGKGPQRILDWNVRLTYRAGEHVALGFAMPQPVFQVLLNVGVDTGIRWSRVGAALDWGLRRVGARRRWPSQSGWWIWPEQDRKLFAWLVKGRVAGLNAGIVCDDDPQRLARLVELERVRQGITGSNEGIKIATWDAVPHISDSERRQQWISVTGLSVEESRAGPGRAFQAA